MTEKGKPREKAEIASPRSPTYTGRYCAREAASSLKPRFPPRKGFLPAARYPYLPPARSTAPQSPGANASLPPGPPPPAPVLQPPAPRPNFPAQTALPSARSGASPAAVVTPREPRPCPSPPGAVQGELHLPRRGQPRQHGAACARPLTARPAQPNCHRTRLASFARERRAPARHPPSAAAGHGAPGCPNHPPPAPPPQGSGGL